MDIFISSLNKTVGHLTNKISPPTDPVNMRYEECCFLAGAMH
jgi:hypothetical protein